VSTEDLDQIKSVIEEIYENYGIDTDDMSDSEFGRICEYYLRNRDELKKHLKASKKVKKEEYE